MQSNDNHVIRGYSGHMSAVSVHASSPGAASLSERDERILAFERQWWKFAGSKEDAVREEFGMSATEYYQVLNALIDSEPALAHDPMLVKRLRRMRASRQRGRAGRAIGASHQR
ncbi:MAG: DUF3263 domain-containing protein [Actinobacteria bacterium HGW-Actinobacteria-8]|nr:MAG: DUF3263 domain-containing protein [Actinobacteria bacterium HGW-Actinobacteria-8]